VLFFVWTPKDFYFGDGGWNGFFSRLTFKFNSGDWTRLCGLKSLMWSVSVKYEVGNDMVHVIAVSRVSKTKSFNDYQTCVGLFPLEGDAGHSGIIRELVNRTYLLTALMLCIPQCTTKN